MDFDQLIHAHVNWRFKIKDYLEGRGSSLDPSTISKDTVCVMGRWIHGDGTKFSSFPEFGDLKLEHTLIHQCAAVVVEKITSGDLEAARALTSVQSEFSTRSSNIVNAVMRLKFAVEKAI